MSEKANVPTWTRYAAGLAGGITGASAVEVVVSSGPVGPVYALAFGILAIAAVLALGVHYIARRQRSEPRFSPGHWESDGWHRIDSVPDTNRVNRGAW